MNHTKTNQKQVRKLYGVISHIEGKKVYMGGHNDTYIKLKGLSKKMNRKTTPFVQNENKFYVLANNVDFPKTLIGEKVIVWAFIKKYRFKSAFEHNKGELIEGWNLYTTKVQKNGNWS